MFNVVYKQIGVAGSHFGKMVANEKQFSVKTSSARRSSVSELGSLETCALYNFAYTLNSKFIRKPSLCSSSYSDVLVFIELIFIVQRMTAASVRNVTWESYLLVGSLL